MLISMMPFLLSVAAAASGAPAAGAATAESFSAPPCSSDESAATVQAAGIDPPDGDMSGRSEALPHGATDKSGQPFGWALRPRPHLGGQPPAGWTRIIPTGMVYAAAGNDVQDVLVSLRDLRLFVRLKTTNQWCLLDEVKAPIGAFFHEDFSKDAHKSANIRHEANGGISVQLEKGWNFHFFSPKKSAIPAGGISGVYADFQARLVGADGAVAGDVGKALYVAAASTDYWVSDNVPAGFVGKYNDDAMIGRFKLLRPEWQSFSAKAVVQPGH